MSQVKITTGINFLDNLIGGIDCGSISQIFGEFSSGKSTFAQQLCVTVQLPKEKGGLESKAVYLSTEKSFYPPKIQKMAIRFGINPDAALKNIIIKEILSLNDLFDSIRIAKNIIEKLNVKLLVVDSIATYFRYETTSLDKVAVRQFKLRKFMEELIKITDILNIACVITNQVVEREDEHRWQIKPVGGNVINNYCKKILEMGKIEDKRYIKIYDAPMNEENYFLFKISDDGIYPLS